MHFAFIVREFVITVVYTYHHLTIFIVREFVITVVYTYHHLTIFCSRYSTPTTIKFIFWSQLTDADSSFNKLHDLSSVIYYYPIMILTKL